MCLSLYMYECVPLCMCLYLCVYIWLCVHVVHFRSSETSFRRSSYCNFSFGISTLHQISWPATLHCFRLKEMAVRTLWTRITCHKLLVCWMQSWCGDSLEACYVIKFCARLDKTEPESWNAFRPVYRLTCMSQAFISCWPKRLGKACDDPLLQQHRPHLCPL